MNNYGSWGLGGSFHGGAERDPGTHGRVHESVRPWQEVVRLETRASCEQDLLVTRHAARARLAHLSESTAESENKEATLLSARPWLAALCNNDMCASTPWSAVVLVWLQLRAEFEDSFPPDSS